MLSRNTVETIEEYMKSEWSRRQIEWNIDLENQMVRRNQNPIPEILLGLPNEVTNYYVERLMEMA